MMDDSLATDITHVIASASPPTTPSDTSSSLPPPPPSVTTAIPTIAATTETSSALNQAYNLNPASSNNETSGVTSLLRHKHSKHNNRRRQSKSAAHRNVMSSSSSPSSSSSTSPSPRMTSSATSTGTGMASLGHMKLENIQSLIGLDPLSSFSQNSTQLPGALPTSILSQQDAFSNTSSMTSSSLFPSRLLQLQEPQQDSILSNVIADNDFPPPRFSDVIPDVTAPTGSSGNSSSSRGSNGMNIFLPSLPQPSLITSQLQNDVMGANTNLLSCENNFDNHILTSLDLPPNLNPSSQIQQSNNNKINELFPSPSSSSSFAMPSQLSILSAPSAAGISSLSSMLQSNEEPPLTFSDPKVPNISLSKVVLPPPPRPQQQTSSLSSSLLDNDDVSNNNDVESILSVNNVQNRFNENWDGIYDIHQHQQQSQVFLPPLKKKVKKD